MSGEIIGIISSGAAIMAIVASIISLILVTRISRSKIRREMELYTILALRDESIKTELVENLQRAIDSEIRSSQDQDRINAIARVVDSSFDHATTIWSQASLPILVGKRSANDILAARIPRYE